MIASYDPALLRAHFPSERTPTPGVFELAIACCGGTATGAYVAGVLDFLWEAFEEWRAAAAAGQAPDHHVRVRYLAGTSAGGLSLGLALVATLKAFPHVYDDALWATYSPGAEQPKGSNPHYRAWVSDVTLDRLLSNPAEVESGEIYLFHDAPSEICTTILGMAAAAPDAAGRNWVSDPLELRATIGNLDGVPHALDFNKMGAVAAVTDEYFLSHRDNVAFAASTGPVGGVATGLGSPPDCYDVNGLTFGPQPAHPSPTVLDIFQKTMGATSAIPLVFKIEQVPQDPRVYDWRSAYWDVARARAVVDLPAWPDGTAPPTDFDATDGGLFDNQPFGLAHQRLAGARGRNPQDGDAACRAVLLIDPLAQDVRPAPHQVTASNIFDVVARLVLSPIEQDRLDTLDLAQIKDETIYSRFMVSPTRENPLNPARAWRPSQSLMSAPLDAFLGFAATAYREHDFLLGRRNAQKFLLDTFALPATNPIVAGAGWGPQDQFIDAGVTYRRLVPLRGRAADPQPEPAWKWQALQPSDIERYRGLLGARADAIFRNLSQTATASLGLLGAPARAGLWFVWTLFARGALLDAFRARLLKAQQALDPKDPARC